MYMKTQGVVLRETRYNDTDKLLNVLTREHGKLTLKARGILRKSSPLKSACQLLAYSEFVIFEYRGFYTINEAQPLDMFLGLRTDIERLALGSYFAQVSEVISQEDSPNPEVLSLLLNCLYGLSRLDRPAALIKTVFELRTACLSGYEPDLSGCAVCGNPFPDRFNLSMGALQCAGCVQHNLAGLRMPLSPGALEAMRYIVNAEAGRLFSFRVGEKTLEELNHITEAYLAAQLERSFYTLDFYKSLLQGQGVIDG